MSKSARAPTMPMGRQGCSGIPGGHFISPSTLERPIQIAFVADEKLSAHEALGGLPMIWGRTVIVWRCSEEEAPREERSGRFDRIFYCEADEDGLAKAALHSVSQVHSVDGI